MCKKEAKNNIISFYFHLAKASAGDEVADDMVGTQTPIPPTHKADLTQAQVFNQCE